LLLVAFLLVNAPNCHLSLVLASVVQGDAVNCNISQSSALCSRFPYMLYNAKVSTSHIWKHTYLWNAFFVLYTCINDYTWAFEVQ